MAHIELRRGTFRFTVLSFTWKHVMRSCSAHRTGSIIALALALQTARMPCNAHAVVDGLAPGPSEVCNEERASVAAAESAVAEKRAELKSCTMQPWSQGHFKLTGPSAGKSWVRTGSWLRPKAH